MNNLNVIDNEFCHAGAPARRRSMSGAPYLRKFGNPLISKLSVITCLSVCPHAEPNSLKYKYTTRQHDLFFNTFTNILEL